MCILFMYVSNNSSKVSCFPYKLILASNRDEKFSRPTKPADFWESSGDSHILAGQDLEELGTWLGISKHGKLSILLNLMGTTASNAENIKSVSRGSLVTGFLRSPPGLPGCTYLKNLCHLDILEKYKPFHFITVSLSGHGTETSITEASEEDVCQCKHLAAGLAYASPICVTYLTNQNQNAGLPDGSNASSFPAILEPQDMTPPADTCKIYALGNSAIGKPFRKVECGKAEFENLVTKYSERNESDDSNTADSLVEELLQFLKSTEKYFPDKTMEEQAIKTKIPQELLPHFSSRFVRIPGIDYGTRTHTILLVDKEDNVTFHEWTMKQPITLSSPEWLHSKFTFTLNS